jgi:type IV secretory pathway VirB2 component (pilin)
MSMRPRLDTLVAFALLLPTRAIAAQADFAPLIERLSGYQDWLYGPVGDFVGAAAILIALGAYTVFPQGLAGTIQRVIYVILLGTGPLIVPILMSVAH